MVERGIALCHFPKIILAANADIRLASACHDEIPSYALNHKVLGTILEHDHLVDSFDKSLQLLKIFMN